MGYHYAVLGAGRQGTAAAYDLAQYGEAQSVVIADQDIGLAQEAAARVDVLLKRNLVQAKTVDVRDHAALVRLLRGMDALVSAVPYRFNLGVARAAIEAGASMCDLGGNTGVAGAGARRRSQSLWRFHHTRLWPDAWHGQYAGRLCYESHGPAAARAHLRRRPAAPPPASVRLPADFQHRWSQQ